MNASTTLEDSGRTRQHTPSTPPSKPRQQVFGALDARVEQLLPGLPAEEVLHALRRLPLLEISWAPCAGICAGKTPGMLPECAVHPLSNPQVS